MSRRPYPVVHFHVNMDFEDQKALPSPYKLLSRDFPAGRRVKNPPSNAGDPSSIPGLGTKTPHATGQVNLHTATTEPTTTREIPHATTKISRTATKA